MSPSTSPVGTRSGGGFREWELAGFVGDLTQPADRGTGVALFDLPGDVVEQFTPRATVGGGGLGCRREQGDDGHGFASGCVGCVGGTMVVFVAVWPRGEARARKALHTGSNPVAASGRPAPWERGGTLSRSQGW